MVATPPPDQRGLIAWFTWNPVAANLLMALIIGVGILSAWTIGKEAFPPAEPRRIEIRVAYPGAAPEEVEEGVIVRIEEAIDEIEGIDEVNSEAREGFALVRLDLFTDTDVARAMDEVKIAIDGISTFPNEIERPVISRTLFRSDVMTLQIHGDIDEASMKRMAERMRDELTALPGVAQVAVQGARPFEISVEIPEQTLRRYGLTLDAVATAIRASSLDLPGGQIRTESGDVRLRTKGQAYVAADFERIVLRAEQDGTRLRLGDVATVRDAFAETEFYSFFDGRRSIGLRVMSARDGSDLDVAKAVHGWLEETRSSLPPGVEVDAWGDTAYYLDERLVMMIENLALGALLVFIVLGLFLRAEVAAWVILGIPVSFLGAFALMQLPFFDVSLNLMSLFGFILVLGIVVDDAIVIGESAYSEMQASGVGRASVIRGAKRVAMPATFGVLTTIAAFTPMVFVEGTIERFVQSIGWVVVFALSFSLIESKLILPAHLAHVRARDPNRDGALARLQARCADGLERFVERRYAPFLDLCVRNRWTTLSVFLGMLMIAGGVVAGGQVRYVFFPEIAADMIRADVELVEGAPESLAVQVLADMQADLDRVNAELKADNDGKDVISHTVVFLSGTNGFILVELAKDHERRVDSHEVTRRWRAQVGEIAGTRSLTIYDTRHTGGGPPVSLRLFARDHEQLDAASQALTEHLRTYDGTFEVQSSATSGTRELRLDIRPEAEALGLSRADLARQVRQAFYGAEAQRIQRGTDEVKVMVRYPESERGSVGDLENMWIRTPDGTEVPFTTVADVTFDEAPSRITRFDGRRAVTVTANVDAAVVEPGQVLARVRRDFLPEMIERYPEVDTELSGASLEERETLVNIAIGALLSLFAIYALMAIPLGSYTQPLIIMAVIPFGVIGAVFGHLLFGMAVSLVSMMGCIALAGVVVNDSLIMVDFVNEAVGQGRSRHDAAVAAGTRRFRAILLTSLTTFFGLVPMLAETSMQAQIMKPMAVSLAFGILFATVITLLLIPCLYVILDDLHSGARRWLRSDDIHDDTSTAEAT